MLSWRYLLVVGPRFDVTVYSARARDQATRIMPRLPPARQPWPGHNVWFIVEAARGITHFRSVQ
jgi:hypothetical protein